MEASPVPVPPRTLLIAALLLAFVLPPTAAAEECLDIEAYQFAEGLRVIANTGSTLAFGVMSNVPGDGTGFVVIITPSLCTGFGVGLGGKSDDPVGTVLRLLPPLEPLP